MKRREFVIGAAATGLAAVSRGWSQSRSNEDKLSRISVMMFGLDSIVKNNKPSSPERTVDIWDFGELCADRYHVHKIELQSTYFPSTEMSWLKDYKARLAKTKTDIVQINLMVALDKQLSESDPARRLEMIDIHRLWLERAAFLGCPRVLVIFTANQENKETIIANLKTLVAIAKPLNIKITQENGGGGGGTRGRSDGSAGSSQQSGRAAQAPPAEGAAIQTPAPPMHILMTECLRAAGAYTCVDFQNFNNENVQHEGIRYMLPYTSGLLHAGMRFDLPKAMAITREMGYKGIYSIKAQGSNPLDTTQKVLDGILANM
jgi:hypothetical protein